jgi:protein O-GlcNAc transferase
MKSMSRDVDILSIFDQGVEAHNTGDLSAAEQLYQKTLATQPNHCEANHNIGVIFVAKNELAKALEFFKLALETSPNVSFFWASYINVLIKLERISESKTLVKALKDAGIFCEKIETISQRLDVEYRDPSAKDCHEVDTFMAQQKFDEAIEACVKLMETYSTSGILNFHLGKCYFELGQVDFAISCYEKVIKYLPQGGGFAMLGEVYSSQGDYDQAIENFKKALKLNPQDAISHFKMGNALQVTGSLEAAIVSFKKVLEIQPDFAEAYLNMGAALHWKGELEAAIDSYKQALKIKLDYAAAHYNMGNALKDKGDIDAAIASYNKALQIKPDHAEAHNNMGIILQWKGELDAAIDSYKQALKIKPDYAEAHSNMGNTLKIKGDLEAAIDSYKQALKLKPDNADAHNNMGNTLKIKGDLEAAIDSYKQALKIKPDYAEAHNNMGNTLMEKGDSDAAIDSYKQALKNDPNNANAKSQMLCQLQHMCHFCETGVLEDASMHLGIHTEAVPPFVGLSWGDNAEQQLARSRVWASEKFKQTPLLLSSRPQSRPARLKIGYFSADFYSHATMYLMAGLLRDHDSKQFELYAYSYGRSKTGDLRKRAERDVDHFFDVTDLADREIIDLAHSHGLDIAIDLKGYTQHTRSAVFQYRLAPIQINYLGYPGSMGASFIDYIIADPIVIPEHQRKFYSESVIYLPHTYQPNDDARKISKANTTRTDFGLPEEAFVFCCFNYNYKISPHEFDIWVRLLRKVDGSVLWLMNSNKFAERNLRKEAEQRGIEPSRLVFAGMLSHSEHLSRHKHADLFIDTFNYNAHTTASDALWSGLPVVTKRGKQFAARVAASLLTAVGLPELITETEEEYERLIFELASDTDKLSAIKVKLAGNRLKEPLFNTKRYTRNFEAGLKAAYSLYFDDDKPQDIWVNDNQ